MDFTDFLAISLEPESYSNGFSIKTDNAASSTTAITIPFLFFLLSATVSIFAAIYFGPNNIKNILQFYYYKAPMRLIITLIVSLFFLALHFQIVAQEQEINDQVKLDRHSANRFALLALNCVQKEFPYKPGHVIQDSIDTKLPKQMHPAFYGCFDWHSSVHGHWMLVRLLKLFPDMELANEIRQKLSANLTKENLDLEAAYFSRSGTKSFERTYGWAWLLKLVEELHNWDDKDGRLWRYNIKDLEHVIVGRYLDFLPRQEYPIRSGEHPNSAFGLSFALNYARHVGNAELQVLVESRARDYYEKDQNCPAAWEPGGSDFLSPCLQEADLMRRVLPINEYWDWLHHFLPGIEEAKPRNLYKPVNVSDRNDPKIVHLDGLNLSRAWCLFGIRNTLYDKEDNRTTIQQAANAHLAATLPYIASGAYEGEHWLASFAVYALSIRGDISNAE